MFCAQWRPWLFIDVGMQGKVKISWGFTLIQVLLTTVLQPYHHCVATVLPVTVYLFPLWRKRPKGWRCPIYIYVYLWLQFRIVRCSLTSKQRCMYPVDTESFVVQLNFAEPAVALVLIKWLPSVNVQSNEFQPWLFSLKCYSVHPPDKMLGETWIFFTLNRKMCLTSNRMVIWVVRNAIHGGWCVYWFLNGGHCLLNLYYYNTFHTKYKKGLCTGHLGGCYDATRTRLIRNRKMKTWRRRCHNSKQKCRHLFVCFFSCSPSVFEWNIISNYQECTNP